MDITGRLAFSTLGCPGWDLDRVLAEAKRMSYAAIEVRGIGDQLQTDTIDAFKPEARDETMRKFTEAGLVISDIASSVLFQDAEKEAPSLAEGDMTIELCDAMGIMGFRVFADHKKDGDWADTMRYVIGGLKTLCERAEAHGNTKVLLEVHGAFNTKELFEELIKELGKYPSFGIIWDVHHSFKVYGNAFEPFYEVIRPYIRHVHLKDCKSEADGGGLCMIGEGVIDIPAIVRQLEKDGYKGYYSLEWEKRWHTDIEEPEVAFPQYVEYMRALA